MRKDLPDRVSAHLTGRIVGSVKPIVTAHTNAGLKKSSMGGRWRHGSQADFQDQAGSGEPACAANIRRGTSAASSRTR